MTPALLRTAQGVAVAASVPGPGPVHVSVCLGERRDLSLLCELVARAFPGLRRESARLSRNGVLHVLVPPESGDGDRAAIEVSELLYGDLIRRQQTG